MPIYEFTCECGSEIERLQKIGTDVPQCLECGGVMLRKFSPISRIQIRSKGGSIIRSKGYKEGYAKDYAKDVEPLRAPWD